MTVYSAYGWRSNAELMVACRELGYLSDEMTILDVTYGLGSFWKAWMPKGLIGCDLDPTKSPIGYSVDFRKTLFDDGYFDAVVLDPPYKLQGTGHKDENDARYGLGDYMPWQDRHEMIREGITEGARVIRPKGYLLVKCMDQVCGGRKRWQTVEFTAWGGMLGLALVDMMHLLTTPRPQPEGRRQVHSLQNFSTLLVFQK